MNPQRWAASWTASAQGPYPVGSVAWSDAVALTVVTDPGAVQLGAHKLAVSFHVTDRSGPITWHAPAMTTSYVSAPGSGAVGQREDESAFPFSTTSWYFLDALEMMATDDTRVMVAFGDSITDGTCSMPNGDDRWPDVLWRRLRARFGNRVAVVNAGIGGNQVVGPKNYSHAQPYRGGPPAVERLERDVLSLSGVSTSIWAEGINDFSDNGKADRPFRCGARFRPSNTGSRNGRHARSVHPEQHRRWPR